MYLGGHERSASWHPRFTPRERAPYPHWIRGWGNPRASSKGVQKKLFEAVWNQTLNPLSSRFLPSFAEFQIYNQRILRMWRKFPQQARKYRNSNTLFILIRWDETICLCSGGLWGAQCSTWMKMGPWLNDTDNILDTCLLLYLPHALYPSENPCRLPWNRTRASAVRSLRLKYLATS